MTTDSKTGVKRTAAAKTALKQRATRAKAVASETIKTGSQVAKRKAADGIDNFPVVALVGGLAVGAVLGALLPRTRQEEDLLGSLGGALNEKAKDAVGAARDAGQAKLDELGISTDSAGKQVGKLIDSFAQVVETAGTAAVDAVRH